MAVANREELAKFLQTSWTTWVRLASLLVGAAWLILRVRARFRDREDPAEARRHLLMQMGELHHEGGLSDEEYRSIKGRLIRPADETTRGRQSKI
jgi:hypothetical protein